MANGTTASTRQLTTRPTPTTLNNRGHLASRVGDGPHPQELTLGSTGPDPCARCCIDRTNRRSHPRHASALALPRTELAEPTYWPVLRMRPVVALRRRKGALPRRFG